MPTSIDLKNAGWVSVTEVLDYFQEPQLVAWKLKVGAKEAKRIGTVAAKTGAIVHQRIYEQWKNQKPVMKSKDSIEILNCLNAWEQFKRDYNPTILDMETELKDDPNKLVGHRDMLIELGKKQLTVDIKTSSSIKPKHWIQVAKYYDMSDSLDKGDMPEIAILRLDKNLGVYEFESKPCDIAYVTLFNSLLYAYRFFNQAPMEPLKEDSNNDSCNSAKDSPANQPQ